MVLTLWGGRDTLHGDTALLIPTGMWLWVGAFLSIACSVQWVIDWYRIPGLFHRHCLILILWAIGWRADWSKGLHKLINKGIYPTNIYGVPAGCQALGTGWWAKKEMVPVLCCWQVRKGLTFDIICGVLWSFGIVCVSEVLDCKQTKKNNNPSFYVVIFQLAYWDGW